MSVKSVNIKALVVLCFFSSLCLTGKVEARPSASQVENWLKAGAAALGIGGTVYSGYNSYMRDGEVRRNFTDQYGRFLFSYTANCRDRQNVSRFWQHPDNGTATAIVARAFPYNVQGRQRAVLALIGYACGYF